MANVKISALPAATTPLAGTEEVPLVQSATTKKVTVANINANATLQQVTAGTNKDLTNDRNLQGTDAGNGNTGNRVNAFGNGSLKNNTGNDVNAFGSDNGIGNSFSSVNFLGNGTVADADQQTVFGNFDGTNTLNARLSYKNISDDRKYELPDASGTIALTDQVWSLTGNSGTNPATNFIGTTDSQDLVFKANSVERLRLDVTTGQVISQSSGDTAIVAKCTSNNGYAAVGGSFMNKGYVEISNGTNVGKIVATNLTASTLNYLPDANGTLVTSVNGALADAQGNVTVPRPYKVYTAVISQQSTSAPTANYVLENTLGFSLTFNYVSPGVYTVTNTDGLGWSNTKTIVFFNPGFPTLNGVVTGWEYNSINQITLYSRNSSTFSNENGLLFRSSFEIRVYP